jgi:IS5 family transposase
VAQKKSLEQKLLFRTVLANTEELMKNHNYRKDLKEKRLLNLFIGDLKQDYGLSRNFYNGIKGDNNNTMLAAVDMNFKRMIYICKKMLVSFFMRMFCIIQNWLLHVRYFISTFKRAF